MVSTDYTEDIVYKNFVDGKLSFGVSTARTTRCVYMDLYLSCVNGGTSRESFVYTNLELLRNRLELLILHSETKLHFTYNPPSNTVGGCVRVSRSESLLHHSDQLTLHLQRIVCC